MTNKKRNWTEKLLFALIIVITLVLMSVELATSIVILNENTANPISTVSYSVDLSELNISNLYTQTYDSATNTTTIENITNIISYICASNLTALNNLKLYDGLNLTYVDFVSINSTYDLTGLILINNTISISNSTLYDNYYSINAECLFNITMMNYTGFIVELFNDSTNETYNVTSDITSLNYFEQQQNAEKIIVQDSTSPVIILSTPINNIYIINTSMNRTTYEVLFNYTASDLSNVNCTLRIHNMNESNVSKDALINSEVLNPLNQTYFFESTITQLYNLTEGNYTYDVSCIDAFNHAHNASSLFKIINNMTSSVQPLQLFLNITSEKSSYALGEIGHYTIYATNYSNVTITICPIASGWVQCYMTPTFVNETYPITQAIPYTNKTGLYLIEGIMRYENTTLKSNITFEVINTVSASITSSEKTAAVNDIITFNATASGGIGAYNYKWIMHDNIIFIGSGAYKNFTTAGTFTEKLFVNDSQGNNYNTSVNVVIKPKYKMTIITFDKNTGSKLSGVLVQIDNYNKTTDSNGEVSFILVEDEYDVYASKDNYGGYLNDLDLNENKTINMNLTIEDFTPPKITLLTESGVIFEQDSVKLKFKAEDITKLSCSIFTAPITDNWFTLKDSGDELSSGVEYTFELTDLAYNNYKWKIECSDINQNSAHSEERNFTITSIDISSTTRSGEATTEDINLALDGLNILSNQEMEVIQILGIKQSLEKLLEKINNLDRDLHDISYRRDLDEQGKQDLEKQLLASVETAKYNNPISLKITDSKTFVKYIRDPELKELLKEYKSLKNLNLNDNSLFDYTKSIQSKATISTKARTITLYYLDGRSSDITLITKEITPANTEEENFFATTKTTTFVEQIPKTIVQTAGAIMFLNEGYEVLKDDPIIEFPASTKRIDYYFNGSRSLDSMQEIDIIIIDKNINTLKSTTAFAILGTEILDFNNLDGKMALSFVVFILVIVYILFNFEIFNKLKNLYYMLFSKKKIHYMHVLINDSLDYLSVNDYDKASLIYREIKLNYEASPEPVRKEVYDDCYDLCNKLDIFYLMELLDKADHLSVIKKEQETLEEYIKIKQTYEKIDDSYKIEVFERLTKSLELIRTCIKLSQEDELCFANPVRLISANHG